MCSGDGDCRPLGFLLGLPFALLSLLISIVGIVVWIVGLLLSCICPCCICVTVIVELALELIKAPIHVMEWFTDQIPYLLKEYNVELKGPFNYSARDIAVIPRDWYDASSANKEDKNEHLSAVYDWLASIISMESENSSLNRPSE